MTHSDEDLVRQIQNGDAAAFNVLFQRYQGAMEGHLRRIVRDAVASDDLVQEVFMRVWNRSDQWQGRGLFKSWLFRIATNLAFNFLRSRKRRREQPLELPAGIQEDDEDEFQTPGWMIDNASLGPDVVLEQAEQQALIRQFVERLPEEKREVFEMVHEADMELKEVAQRLDIPEGTVKSRLYHARRKIAADWQGVKTEWEEIECH